MKWKEYNKEIQLSHSSAAFGLKTFTQPQMDC